MCQIDYLEVVSLAHIEKCYSIKRQPKWSCQKMKVKIVIANFKCLKDCHTEKREQLFSLVAEDKRQK